ncbi:MAG: biopolymer transporter ExbD [Gemmatimonadaceae bacterium]|nr:biopolymer transporter ExbD [Gemmatimonadaceae bacterium]
MARTSRFHRSRFRRAERGDAGGGHGEINLVPLVDILTSIVFFSLLTYSGSMLAALTSFDLVLPPLVVEAREVERDPKPAEVLELILAVRINEDHFLVEHSGNGGFRRRIERADSAALDSLESQMSDIRAQFPQNRDVLVIPADGIPYDDIVRVLERLKRSRFSAIALGTKARATPVSTP